MSLSLQIEKALMEGFEVSVPASLTSWLEKLKGNYIDGQWKFSSKTFQSTNPATGKALATLSIAGKEDVDAAAKAARDSFVSGSWSRQKLSDRKQVLKKMAQRIFEHQGELAILESLDTGKPIREAYEGDILRAGHNFEFFSDFASDGQKSLAHPKETHTYYREPLGVVALITPWNLPLYLETWKLAPALAMGNSCILKPSELTPLTATYFVELVADLVPKGVLQLVQGFGESSTGEFLSSHPEVDAISFTGETSTGRAIMKSAASGPRRVSFELGGKGASVVFEDCAWDATLNETLRAAYRNQGEICLACPRVYVHEKIYDKFISEFSKRASEIVVGNPLHGKTQMGALISQDHLGKVTSYLKKVSKENFRLGGEPLKREGSFLEPTVLVGLSDDHPVTTEEVFGPVASIYSFNTEDEVIRRVNNTPYGLSTSIYTNDLKKAERVSREIHAGLVWVNCWFVRDFRVPFGGQKKSGVGREGGEHSLDFFSEWKSVCVRTV